MYSLYMDIKTSVLLSILFNPNLLETFRACLHTYKSQKTGHQATLGLVNAVPNIRTLRMVSVCILPSIMEGFTGLKFFTIS